MKLTDTQTMTMEDILKECDIIKQNFHTDDNGNVMAIEVKYRPKDVPADIKVPDFMSRR